MQQHMSFCVVEWFVVWYSYAGSRHCGCCVGVSWRNSGVASWEHDASSTALWA